MSKASLQERPATSGREAISTLIVDDSPHWVKSLRSFLALHPVISVVGVAYDGLEGLAMAATLRPALVLLDLQMPRLGGMEAAPIIRERCPDVVVVMMTANRHPEVEARCRAKGVHAFIAKSEVRRALLPAVRAFFPGTQP